MMPSRRPGRYCIRLRWLLMMAVSWSTPRTARLRSRPFRLAHTPSAGLSSGAQAGSPKAVNQGPGVDERAHRRSDVGAEIVPDQHDRRPQLVVSGRQQGLQFGDPEAILLA
ncbi:MAG: hypothetical protein JWL97_3531 [Gemmatimonadales bacterium]|nr:hypothetical protein [Gemmatimonadales bacterium]